MATIFIVDDDQAIGEMLSLVLENEGFQTVTCLDGLRAVEMFLSLYISCFRGRSQDP